MSEVENLLAVNVISGSERARSSFLNVREKKTGMAGVNTRDGGKGVGKTSAEGG